jgi:phosphoglycerate dehydrogenase-like enzyme
MAREKERIHACVGGYGASFGETVTRLIEEAGREIVCVEPAELEARLGEVRVLLCSILPRVDWSRATALRLLQTMGSGTDLLWPARGLPPGVLVANARGIHLPEMRDHALAMMLAFARKLPSFLERQRERAWTVEPVGSIAGKTVGILGLGEVGRAVGLACRALGMHVVGIRFDAREAQEVQEVQEAHEVFGPGALDRVLAASEYLVVLLPLTPETRGLIGARALGLMRRGAVIVHLSRGGIVDERALLEALRTGALAGAAIDVFEEEPLPAASPLWTAPNLILTPHVAGLVPDYVERAVRLFLENLDLVERGLPPRTLVHRDRGY